MKDRFKEVLRTVDRKGMEELIVYLEKNGFFEAPCSGANHLAKEAGLLEHSLNVYSVASDVYEFEGVKKVPYESLILVTLLHDVGKIGDYGKPNYVENMIKDGRPTKANPEQKYKRSEAKPYVTNTELLYVPHEIRSISIITKFIDLTEEEYFAILYHNGMYGDLKYALTGKETPLYLLLHFADMWCSRVLEVEKDEAV